MNNEAIEKLAEIIYDKVESAPRNLYLQNEEKEARQILAAIQSDPMAYGIKPKPLVWQGIYAETVFGAYYQILVSRTGKSHCLSVVFKDSSHTIGHYHKLEAAQAAANDDLCKRVKELH